MTRKQTIEDIAILISLPRRDVRDVLTAYWENLYAKLSDGKRADLPYCGSLSPVRRKPRTFRNPKTGEEVLKPERIVVKFRAGKSLKQALSDAV